MTQPSMREIGSFPVFDWSFLSARVASSAFNWSSPSSAKSDYRLELVLFSVLWSSDDGDGDDDDDGDDDGDDDERSRGSRIPRRG